MTNHKKIAILGAMPQEIAAYQERYSGTVSAAISGVGKPAAAAATQRMISELKPDCLFFTGVGGALDRFLKIGDIGICVAAIDADLDVRPWNTEYRRGEVPFSRERVYESHHFLVKKALDAFKGRGVFSAYVASGSRFLDVEGKKSFIANEAKDLSATITGIHQMPNVYEMEGSAFLQVAAQNKVPALLVRAISDTLEGDAPEDFNAFIKHAVSGYVKILDYLIETLGREA